MYKVEFGLLKGKSLKSSVVFFFFRTAYGFPADSHG